MSLSGRATTTVVAVVVVVVQSEVLVTEIFGHKKGEEIIDRFKWSFFKT